MGYCTHYPEIGDGNFKLKKSIVSFKIVIILTDSEKILVR